MNSSFFQYQVMARYHYAQAKQRASQALVMLDMLGSSATEADRKFWLGEYVIECRAARRERTLARTCYKVANTPD